MKITDYIPMFPRDKQKLIKVILIRNGIEGED